MKDGVLQTAPTNSDGAVSPSDGSGDGEGDGGDEDDTGDNVSDGPPDIISSTNTNGTAADSNLGVALKSDTLANFTMPSAEQPQSDLNATDADAGHSQASTSDEFVNSTASTGNDIPAPLPTNHRLFTSGGYFHGGAPSSVMMGIMACIVVCLTFGLAVIH